ncbi:glycosyltransferase family 8 protein [Hymenobacter jejuensis]|uniref:Glycosyltransferase family 8 protein n=1 Tax=Hymenobacter jejuensis TaxID=2502781 RepID=A0A5B7ZW22_9BACT|nr:glycosyltransferase family 8 protein [Hymenobacter jejuensis]QDA59341.1 glycosyltransferase family 8 protein [Hymenobacter jejuensis]
MVRTDSSVHLAIAFDENYLEPFYALITSVFQNNPQNRIEVHAIATGVSDASKRGIEEYIQRHGSAIHFYQVDEEYISRFVLTSKWTPAVYYRLFFPLLVPASVERLLYIDTDTLVVGDLREFDKIELGSYPVAAAYDNWVKTNPDLGITEEGKYFNSGVLLMNVPEWKKQNVSEKAIDFLLKYPEKIKFVDQDALNAVLIGNWLRIDNRYNLIYSLIPETLPRKEFDAFLADKVILHFTLQRPWTMLCQNRFRYLYRRYLAQSPFKSTRRYTDFAVSKIPRLMRIRLRELYFDNPSAASLWQRLKGSVS